MEYKRIWMPYNTDFFDALMRVSPYDDEDTNKADDEIKQLLKKGWRIVSTAPVTESRAYNKKGFCNMPNRYGTDMVYTFTRGLEVFLVKE